MVEGGAAWPPHTLYVEEFEDMTGGLLGAQCGLGVLGDRSIDDDTDLYSRNTPVSSPCVRSPETSSFYRPVFGRPETGQRSLPRVWEAQTGSVHCPVLGGPRPAA